jgi:hypothetical protein
MKRLAVTVLVIAASPLILAGAFVAWALYAKDAQLIRWVDDAD